MAYRDIEMWKQILEAEDQEKKAYDEACAFQPVQTLHVPSA